MQTSTKKIIILQLMGIIVIKIVMKSTRKQGWSSGHLITNMTNTTDFMHGGTLSTFN